MDQICSYEFAKQNPVRWSNSIPSNLKRKVHFINVGVSADIKSEHNPLTLIKSIAKPRDFVAFKLDIDTSSIEIPLFLQLLEDPAAYNIVDEFIFELHYNCPVMIGWWRNVSIPIGYEDKIVLSRVDALKKFSELRHKGIRSHFWV